MQWVNPCFHAVQIHVTFTYFINKNSLQCKHLMQHTKQKPLFLCFLEFFLCISARHILSIAALMYVAHIKMIILFLIQSKILSLTQCSIIHGWVYIQVYLVCRTCVCECITSARAFVYTVVVDCGSYFSYCHWSCCQTGLHQQVSVTFDLSHSSH